MPGRFFPCRRSSRHPRRTHPRAEDPPGECFATFFQCPPPRLSRAALRKAFSQLTFHNQLSCIESHQVNPVFAPVQFTSRLVEAWVRTLDRNLENNPVREWSWDLPGKLLFTVCRLGLCRLQSFLSAEVGSDFAEGRDPEPLGFGRLQLV